MLTILPGNRIDLLHNGAEYFPALIEAIASARHEVRLETYIFADDDTARAVAAALAAAAQRGVRVHVVVDGFGSPDFMLQHGRALIAAGAEVFIYRPEIARFRLRRHRLRRLHRKLVCVDACTAFVGGINIIADHEPNGPSEPRFDYAVRVSGSLLAPIHLSMCRLWSLLRWVNLGRRFSPAQQRIVCVDQHGHSDAAFVVRNNLRHRRDIEEAYLDAINGAQHEIMIANAYFLPGRRFRRALTDAAARGVSVTLLIQGRVEHWLQHYASQTVYTGLLAKGVAIHAYYASYLHAKVAVIDDRWATVGSSNIDPFSLFVAREANVVVLDPAFNARLKASLQQAIAGHSAPFPPLHKQPAYQRLFGWFAYGAMRTLLGFTGYGRDF